MDTNPYQALVENIPVFIMIDRNDQVDLSEKWRQRLKDNHMWLQVINQDGQVIYASNTPEDLQDAYSMHDLFSIEETKRLAGYHIDTYYESWTDEPYYFLFGHDDPNQTLLDEWYDEFSEDGMIDSSKIPELEEELDEQSGMIDVYQQDELVQTIGSELDDDTSKLDLLGFIHTPGKQKAKAETTWVFQVLNEDYEEQHHPVFSSTELRLFLLSTGISLGVAIAFSIWSGYRYGNPLLLIIHWLEGVENNQYDTVFSKKERRKLFKRNGKIKFRYRLYKEVIESFSDMTRKLATTEKEREQLEKTREEWMAGISHDLRTPLSSIQGYGHMLESDKYQYTDKELQNMGQIIREKSDYMVDLLNDFSLVFKLKNSAVSVDKAPIDMNQFVKNVVRKFQNDLTLNDYTFKYTPQDVFMTADIDPKWFTRALDNLISNAVLHNPPRTMVKVSLRHQHDQIIIEIADNGRGMDEAFQNKLFERYYRGTSTQERADGEGLGMSIAKAIIELHNGQIDVQSKKDEGTTITIIVSSRLGERLD